MTAGGGTRPAGSRSGVHAFQLARSAPLPGVVQLELVGEYGYELLLNSYLAPEAADALVDAVLDGRLHPMAASEVDERVVRSHLGRLASREGVHPAALEWLGSHRLFEDDGRHWDELVDALEGLCEQERAGLRLVHRTQPADVGVRLVNRAPGRVRRRLAGQGSMLDRVRVLCLEYADGPGSGSGGAGDDEVDVEYLVAGDLVTEPVPTTDSLLMLAALCRARPRLGVHLGERFVELPEAAARWSPHTVTLFAWTVPWRRTGHWRRQVPDTAVLAERLTMLSRTERDRASAEVDDQLAVLVMAPAVPDALRDRASAALSGRRALRSAHLDCHESLFGGEGHRLASAALSGGRGRKVARIAGALAAELAGAGTVRRAEPVPAPAPVALCRVCGDSPERWRLAVALSDGTLSGEELADCIAVTQ